MYENNFKYFTIFKLNTLDILITVYKTVFKLNKYQNCSSNHAKHYWPSEWCEPGLWSGMSSLCSEDA